MKTLYALLICLSVSLVALGQPGNNQESNPGSFKDWELLSRTQKNLLPRYGHLSKTEKEILADSTFIKAIMALPQFKTRREASNHFINLGFDYYERNDLKTAMARFNQAYLLDSTNSDDYWGYGAVYMKFGMLYLAANQYDLGLKIDSTNSHLWTDYATVWLAQYYATDNEDALDKSIIYLEKSYLLNPKDVNNVYKLSVSYWNKNKCVEAWKYYDESVALGGQPITKKYDKDLKKRCKRK